jgi:hypothetical protein
MKRALRRLLEEYRLDEVADMASRAKRVLGQLVTLTFHPEPQMGWRAVEAMGVAAARIAEDDPVSVRQHLRRLHWLLSEESGGICWRAPEAMAEIVRRRPDLFADYAPIVAHLLVEMAEEDLQHFRVGVLWAIGRLGPGLLDESDEALAAVVDALGHPDAQVRGVAVWSLGQVRSTRVLDDRQDLLEDEGGVELYAEGVLNRTTVGEITKGVLAASG